MLFKTQAERYIQEIQTRRRGPVRASTARIYQSYLDARILPELGEKDVSNVENGIVKAFIANLSASDLSPSTINSVFKVVKAVVASAVDSNGNEMYPRKWNHDFVDLPIVNKANQNTPTIAREAVQTAISEAFGQDKALYVILASTGLRIGEALSLQDGAIDNHNSYWDAQTGILHIKTTLVNGVVQPNPKTEAGVRQVDLAPEVNEYLKQAGLPLTGFLFRNNRGGPVCDKTARRHLENAGIIEGFHSFRRFRITHLEAQNVPRGLAMYWTGHAEKDVHGSYIKIGQDLQTRKEWAVKAGLGFQLPEAK
jgi:integrase